VKDKLHCGEYLQFDLAVLELRIQRYTDTRPVQKAVMIKLVNFMKRLLWWMPAFEISIKKRLVEVGIKRRKRLAKK